jgi:hypothetical protein
LEQILTDTGAGHRQIIQSHQGGLNLARLLVKDAFRSQTPSRTAWKSRVAARDQVVKNRAVRWSEIKINNAADPLTITIQQRCLHQSRQAFQHHLIGDRRFAAHKNLLICETTTLV